MDTNPPELLLFTTEGCHLCELAINVLSQAIDLETVYVELVDIAEGDDSDQLIEQYGVRIPVVQHQPSGAEIGWPFDAAAFQEWYQAAAKG